MATSKPRPGGLFQVTKDANNPGAERDATLSGFRVHVQVAGSRPVKVLIVDDHPIARAGVVSLLLSHDWLVVVGEASDGQEAIQKAKALRPDLVVVDINLPKLSGLALTKNLHAELPQTRVVILSMHELNEVAPAVVESGAWGFVCKKVATTDLINALETVASGQTFFGQDLSLLLHSQSLQDESAASKPKISPREREVLVGIAEGLSNKEVADRLGLGIRTVETHRMALMRKLNLHNVAGLTRFALQKGLISAF
jgi:two-component system, NarL family, nitrate/nitrite response regulator NarL